MKTRKMFVAAFVLSMALAVFGGCDGNVVTTPHSTDDPTYHVDTSPIDILFENNHDIETVIKAIIGEINTSRSMSEAEHRDHGNYRSNKIPEITEFYSPIEIEGFDIINVLIGEHGFVYYYAPTDREDVHPYRLPSGCLITIIISRQETQIDSKLKEEIAAMNNATLTADGFIYSDWGGINAWLGNIGFRVDVPEKLNCPDFLRDLALQVIETAVLVIV